MFLFYFPFSVDQFFIAVEGHSRIYGVVKVFKWASKINVYIREEHFIPPKYLWLVWLLEITLVCQRDF